MTLSKLRESGTIARVALVLTLSAIASFAANGQTKSQPVTVVNPTANPVNTTITNPVVPVEVTNADPIPVVFPESEGSREIFYRELLVRFENNTFTCNQAPGIEARVDLPVGKRLVLEYVSALFQSPPTVELIGLDFRPNGFGRVLVVPATTVKDYGATSISLAAQYVHSYFDSGFRVCAFDTGPTTLEVRVFMTGYLVDKL